jgi:hypothetical protein
MPVLALITGVGWRVEIKGKAVRVPDVVGIAHAISRIAGPGKLELFPPDAASICLSDGVASHPPLLFENTEYDIYLVRDSASDVELELPPTFVSRYDEGGFSHCTVNFRNDVGFFDIGLRCDGTAVRVTLEVFPTKVDYRADYIQMRDEVAGLARNLIMSVHARTFALAEPRPTAMPTLAEWSSLLQGYFSTLMRLGNAITANPQTVLERCVESKPIEKVRKLDRAMLRSLLRRQVRKPSGITTDAGFPLPAKLPELIRRTTYDTPENRYIKYLLTRTASRLQQISSTSDTGDDDADKTAEEKFFDHFRPIARKMLREVERLIQNSFLHHIRPSADRIDRSQVLQKHATYSAFARTARVLNGGLSVTGGVLRIGIKHIAELYEYWCFLKLVSLLRERFGLKQQSIVKLKHTGVVVTLEKGKQAAVRFIGSTGEQIELIYNRTFIDLPTLPQKPDNIIQLTNGSTLHILDAKYRVAFDDRYLQQFATPGPTPEDINTMHRYRDAIVLPEVLGGGGYTRGAVRDAVVLFPYRDEEIYKSHRFFSSINKVQIGGLPLLPAASSLVEAHIDALLRSDGVIVSSDGGQNQP